MNSHPIFIVLLSGKRKTGKDYTAELLKKKLGPDRCSIFRLSGPLKRQYAQQHNLDFTKLLDSSEYKERYREDMIKWGEEKRTQDPGFFCRLSISSEDSSNSIWVVSDCRRLSDINYFKTHFQERVLTVRLTAEEDVRKQRGFHFTKGVDDAESECGLDSGVHWDYVLDNNSSAQLEESIKSLVGRLENRKYDSQK